VFGKLFTRADPTISMTDWAKLYQPGSQVAYGGSRHQGFKMKASSPGAGYYSQNSVVFALTMNRILLFAEARFQWQTLTRGNAGDLFGDESLRILEKPWAGATTRDLLTQAELDVSTAGNSYWVQDREYPQYMMRLDPEKVILITERAIDDIYGFTTGERLLAYAYRHDLNRPEQSVFYDPSEVAHYKPIPDLKNRFLGMSWISACIPDIEADTSITDHKTTSLATGATIPYVVTLNEPGLKPDAFDHFVARFRETHEGPQNSGKTLFLGGGADIKTIGQNWQELDMRAIQGADETRIAAAAGVPPVIAGLSEGLASATYSNYSQARRRLADGTMRPLWGSFAAAMQSLCPPPRGGARLWYDDRDIPWLREDIKDRAEVAQNEASTLNTLISAGFTPKSAVRAVNAGDMTLLEHSGLVSVQLQAPGAQTADPALEKALPALPKPPVALPAGK
jgi:phage portal protein BeeE